MWWYSQSCNIHYPLRWRIKHYINLNNICKVVSSQRVSLNAGQKGSAPHGLLPFRRLRFSRPCFLSNRNQYKMLEMKLRQVRRRVCLSCNTQCYSATCFELHFYAKETWRNPFALYIFSASCGRFCFSLRDTCIDYYMVSCYLFLRFGGSGRSFSCVG